MTKECYLCHRIGTRGFVPHGDWAWVCARDDVCRRRRELSYVDIVTETAEWLAATEPRRR